MTVLGFVLYGSTVLVPLLLQTLLGYPALQAGIAMLPRGLGSFVMMPVVGFLMGKIEARRLLGAGILIATFAFWNFSHLNLDVGYWNFFWPLIIQGAAMGFLFVPLTTITNDPIPNSEMGNATSLFNLMRNIGGSIGIAVTGTMIARQTRVVTGTLGEHVSMYDPATQQMFQRMQAAFMAAGADMVTATNRAYAAMFGMLSRQAAMVSFVSLFQLLGIVFLLLIPLVLLMKRPGHGGPAVGAH